MKAKNIINAALFGWARVAAFSGPRIVSSAPPSLLRRASSSNNEAEGDEDTTKRQQQQQQQYRPGSLMAATIAKGRVPYGEESRKYRRTVFSHDDWVEHRNSERIANNLSGMFFSGVVRQLYQEIMLVAGVATFVVFWNGWLPQLLQLPLPQISLPQLPFTLSSPALGLLLVFRTNASFTRWSEARNTWAKITSQSRNLVRMACAFSDLNTSEGRRSVKRLTLSVWLLCRSLMNKLSGPEDRQPYEKEVRAAFTASGDDNDSNNSLVERILNAPDCSVAALGQVSLELDAAPIDEKRRVEIDKSLVLICDCMGICEKIYTSPVPLVYTRHTARFLSLWMLTLPAALYNSFATASISTMFPALQSLALIPTVAIVALFLFGIEELAIQLEEPFSILPMQKFCDGVRDAGDGLTSWCTQSALLEDEQRSNK